MKCIAAVVMVTFAIVAQGSNVPSIYARNGYHVYNPTIIQSNDQHSWAHASAVHDTWSLQTPIVAYNSWDAPFVPAAAAYNNHHHTAAVTIAPVQNTATYVAANRGAVHKAPLVGHTVNQMSLNLAPAPGTW